MFRSRASNYKSTQQRFLNKEAVPKQSLKQKHFHDCYCSHGNNTKEDWVITLTDCADTLKELNRKELYYMYKLKNYAWHNLNKRHVFDTF